MKPFVIIMILSTFLMVGFDVGMNSNIANFLRTKFDISLESASFGISTIPVSFVGFLGAIPSQSHPLLITFPYVETATPLCSSFKSS